MSCHVMSCRVASRRVASRRVMSYHVMPGHVMPYHIVSCRIASCYVAKSGHKILTQLPHSHYANARRSHSHSSCSYHSRSYSLHSHHSDLCARVALSTNHSFRFRLPAHVLYFSFRCGVIRSYISHLFLAIMCHRSVLAVRVLLLYRSARPLDSEATTKNLPSHSAEALDKPLERRREESTIAVHAATGLARPTRVVAAALEELPPESNIRNGLIEAEALSLPQLHRRAAARLAAHHAHPGHGAEVAKNDLDGHLVAIELGPIRRYECEMVLELRQPIHEYPKCISTSLYLVYGTPCRTSTAYLSPACEACT